jgi:hypothetical protein
VPDAPDPLGKRALFWAPAERHEEGPRTPDVVAVPGKHALFSDVGSHRALSASGARSGAPGLDRGVMGRGHHPSNRRPDAPVDGSAGRRWAAVPDELERPAGSGMFGSLTLHCSSCRVRSRVDLVEYIALHLPVWFWRPGRGYTRFMTCPSCRRRTWVSASWTSQER